MFVVDELKADPAVFENASVTVPVPERERDLSVAIVTAPLSDIAPVPVEKVVELVCEKLPDVVIAPDVIAPVPAFIELLLVKIPVVQVPATSIPVVPVPVLLI